VAHCDLIISDVEIGSETMLNDLELSPSGFIVDAWRDHPADEDEKGTVARLPPSH
jgi:hypothetical protein